MLRTFSSPTKIRTPRGATTTSLISTGTKWTSRISCFSKTVSFNSWWKSMWRGEGQYNVFGLFFALLLLSFPLVFDVVTKLNKNLLVLNNRTNYIETFQKKVQELFEKNITCVSCHVQRHPSKIRHIFTIYLAIKLEALSVHDWRAGLVVLLFLHTTHTVSYRAVTRYQSHLVSSVNLSTLGWRHLKTKKSATVLLLLLMVKKRQRINIRWSTSVGRWRETREWILRSRPSTCAQAGQQPWPNKNEQM